MISKIDPNYGYTVLKPLSAGEQKAGAIIIPDMGKEKPGIGEIIEFEPTYNFNTDTTVPYKFEKGDHVFYPTMAAKKLTHEQQDYVIVSNQDLISRIKQ